jgi:hypothetical protein
MATEAHGIQAIALGSLGCAACDIVQSSFLPINAHLQNGASSPSDSRQLDHEHDIPPTKALNQGEFGGCVVYFSLFDFITCFHWITWAWKLALGGFGPSSSPVPRNGNPHRIHLRIGPESIPTLSVQALPQRRSVCTLLLCANLANSILPTLLSDRASPAHASNRPTPIKLDGF